MTSLSNTDVTTFTVDANTTTYAQLVDGQTALCQYMCIRMYECIEQYQRLTASDASIFPNGVANNLSQLAASINLFGNGYAADSGLTSIAVGAGVAPAPSIAPPANGAGAYTVLVPGGAAPPEDNMSSNSVSNSNTTVAS